MRRATTLILAALAASALAACASTPGGAPGAPDYAPIAGTPAGPRGALYADCIGQAVSARTYDRVDDPDTHLLRFRCSGEPARAFYDGLAGRSAARNSQWTAEGRTWRSTNRVIRNLFGVDHCSADGEADHQCVVVLNAGEFLTE